MLDKCTDNASEHKLPNMTYYNIDSHNIHSYQIYQFLFSYANLVWLLYDQLAGKIAILEPFRLSVLFRIFTAAAAFAYTIRMN